jgi:hypothetical protein
MEFNDRYRYVCERLRAEHDPQLGVSGLPDAAREAVYDMAYFFQSFAVLRLLQVVDDEVTSITDYRAARIWDAIAPFVRYEREISAAHGHPNMLWILEQAVNNTRPTAVKATSQPLRRRRRHWRKAARLLRKRLVMKDALGEPRADKHVTP